MSDKFPPKTQIAYIPHHANGNIEHKDVQFGFVTSSRVIDGQLQVWCRYWLDLEKYPGLLRTKANSERVNAEMLVKHKSVPGSKIEEAWDEYVKPSSPWMKTEDIDELINEDWSEDQDIFDTDIPRFPG